MDLLINLGSILYLPRVMQPTAEARLVVASRSICVGRAMPLLRRATGSVRKSPRNIRLET